MIVSVKVVGSTSHDLRSTDKLWSILSKFGLSYSFIALDFFLESPRYFNYNMTIIMGWLKFYEIKKNLEYIMIFDLKIYGNPIL